MGCCGSKEKIEPVPQEDQKGPRWLVNVSVLQGRELAQLDSFSKSDPYVQVTGGGITQRSQAIKNDSNPVWNASFKFVVYSQYAPHSQVVLRCFDHDRLKKDQLIGSVSIDLDPIHDKAHSSFMWLEIKSPAGKVTGKLQVAVSSCRLIHNILAGDGENLHQLAENDPLVQSHLYTHLLTFRVVGARNLDSKDHFGEGNAYCVAEWGDHVFKTGVKSSANPVWKSEAAVWMNVQRNSHFVLKLETMDADKLGKDHSTGVAYIPAAQMIASYLHQEGKNEVNGEEKDEEIKDGEGGVGAAAAAAAAIIPVAHGAAGGEKSSDLAANAATVLVGDSTSLLPNALWLRLKNPKVEITSDKTLSGGVSMSPYQAEDAPALDKPNAPCGELLIEWRMKTVDQVAHDFYDRLLQDFDSNQSGQLDKNEIHMLLHFLNVQVDQAAFEEWFDHLDASGDGTLSFVDVKHLMRELERSNRDANITLYSYMLHTGKKHAKQDVLMHGVSHSRTSSTLQVLDRSTGLLVKENIPRYISVALKAMFNTKAGRLMSTVGSSEKIMQSLSVKQGVKYDDPKSCDALPAFVKLHNLNLDEVEKPLAEYRTFNEFFARKLKPEARPIAELENDAVAVSPADCRLSVFRDVTEATTLWIKGKNFTLENVLGPAGPRLAPRLLGGSMVIARLAPQDYHRWHTPVSGVLGQRTPIDGALYTVNPIAVNKQVDVYTRNKREILEIESPDFGLVVAVAVGATMVGSISITAEDNSKVKKGDLWGYFSFGGSTVLLFFEPGAIEFDDDLLQTSSKTLETLIKVGSRIGVCSRRKDGAAAAASNDEQKAQPIDAAAAAAAN